MGSTEGEDAYKLKTMKPKIYICIYVYVYTICIFFLIKDFFKGKDNNKREYIEKLYQSMRSNIQATEILKSENIKRRRKLLIT